MPTILLQHASFVQTIICITGVYAPLYPAVHPVKYVESDVMVLDILSMVPAVILPVSIAIV